MKFDSPLITSEAIWIIYLTTISNYPYDELYFVLVINFPIFLHLVTSALFIQQL